MLFRMIPRFPPVWGVRECATSTVATCADMGMGPGATCPSACRLPGTCRHQSEPAHGGAARLIRPSAPRTTPPRTTPEALTPVADVLTHHNLDAEPDRSRAGTRPISTRRCTDLGAEPDRSRHGVRPISVWTMTDLEPECDRSRRLSAVTPVRGGRPRA